MAASSPKPRRSRACSKGLPRPSSLTTFRSRIEIYDNSHIMGTNAVGGMVVAGPEGFVKEPVPQVQHQIDRHHARRRLRHDEGSDDAAVLAADQGRGKTGSAAAEPVRRHAGFPAWPDVILIDGGQGQMTAVRAILEELGIEDSVTAIGVAKGVDRDAGRERFFPPGREASRCRRATRCFISSSACATRRIVSLSARTGRGARRKWSRTRSTRSAASGRRASARCSSISARQRRFPAPASTISMAVEGISEAVARQVYNHFHEDGAK